MEQQHTPEPLAYGEDNDGWYVEKDGDQIAWCLTEENARRIVACVNACAGIPTASLECMEVCHLDSIHRQRDELLAALIKAAEEIRKCDYTPARSTLLVAIARVKGDSK